MGWWAWEYSPGGEELGGTGDLTLSIRVLKITPVILTYKKGTVKKININCRKFRCHNPGPFSGTE